MNFFKDFQRPELEEKWWHRLFKVAFAISTILIFFFWLRYFPGRIMETSANTTVIGDLGDFTASSDLNIDNTIPSFLRQRGILGCYNPDTKIIDRISSADLQNGICNPDFERNADVVVNLIVAENQGQKNLSKNVLKSALLASLNQEKTKKYCLLPKNINCDSSRDIVVYTINGTYYAQMFLIAAVFTLIWYFITVLFYFKGLIYIIYGRKK